MTLTSNSSSSTGILLINKTRGITSFRLVSILRRILQIQKIGHAGTLDPFATGVMVMLIGKDYTRLSDHFLGQNKEYEAMVRLGQTTDTYDCDGTVLSTSEIRPSLCDIESALEQFQGTILQIPPMYSAIKIQGKKLYELARKGIEVERKPREVNVQIELLSYHYPLMKVKVACSKGTYIRSLAFDIGQSLGCGAHLSDLHRTKSGPFHVGSCVDVDWLCGAKKEEIEPFLLKKTTPSLS